MLFSTSILILNGYIVLSLHQVFNFCIMDNKISISKIGLLLKPLFSYFGVVALFWILTFQVFRIVFLAINWMKSAEVPLGELLKSFIYGLRFDASITGYILMLHVVVFGLGLWLVPAKWLYRTMNIINKILIVPIVIFLIINGFIYSFWGVHVDASALHFLESPTLVIASLTWVEKIALPLILIVVCWGVIYIYGRISKAVIDEYKFKVTLPAGILRSFLILLMGGVMIIPVRGGTGIAPLNTGMSFFSTHLFANHVALNPVWNFLYSLKRLKATTATYKFMDDKQAESIFDELMEQSGEYPKVLNTNRPNIILIMLESFSSHAIEILGGENATPVIKSLQKESIFFTNMMAASDRSGKGMVSVICGYPVLPAFSIINYPQKTQSLSFIPQELRKNGYADQAFLYGGDLGFNNFNSLVTMAGFNRIITENDFDASMMSDKWGAHDGFVFDRLLATIEEQKEPFFNMFFTLSSHEPFTVPMEKQLEDVYLNSVFYTDKCLGEFIEKAKQQPWWDNTLLILIADHGHAGPKKVGNDSKERFHIPMVWTGGAVAVTDSIVEKQATQIDLASTLLAQLGIDHKEFNFSKNLMDKGNSGFSFYDFSDGFGFIRGDHFQVYDNQARRFIKYEGATVPTDTLAGKAILQMMSNDYQKR